MTEVQTCALPISETGTRVAINADFDWGIPVLEKYVSKVLALKARVAFEGMLKALKKEAEKSI